MEIARFYKRLENISNNFEKAYENDINFIIDNLFEEYDILYKDTNITVHKNIILNKFLSILGKTQDDIICNGFSQNGNKCFRKASRDSEYCKTHSYLAFKQHNLTTKPSGTQDIVVFVPNNQDNININGLKKQLIEDTFYYIDDTYIYNIDSLERVGYIEDSKFYLTDDPFILNV